MTCPDPFAVRAVELLSRGHGLFAGDASAVRLDAMPADLHDYAERIVRTATGRGDMSVAVQQSVRMADALRRTAESDAALSELLADAGADHRRGHRTTAAILDEAHDDKMPATDTPLGRREALRRSAARLRSQQRHIRRARNRSAVLARRMQRLAYLSRRRTARIDGATGARAIPVAAVRYDKNFAPGHVRQRVATALDRMGIHDPQARRNWLRGYETLIARESGERASAVASEPAMAAGPTQSDNHGLGYARGLTQTIPATFVGFHQPGTSTNIYDPVANICASMNYVMHRYGVSPDGSNLTALVQQADTRRPPKGY